MLEDTLVVVAKKQTKGKGQMGTKWRSKEGESVAFSVFKRFNNISVLHQPYIAFAISIGVQTALEKLKIPSVSIKWPNDIMSYQKKVAGILIENQIKGTNLEASVIGVGLNVNESEFEGLPNATSLFLATNKKYDLDVILESVSEAILSQLERVSVSNFETLKLEYEASLFRKNKVSVFENTMGKQFNGIIKGVTDTGELLVEKEDQQLNKYQLKEIKLLL